VDQSALKKLPNFPKHFDAGQKKFKAKEKRKEEAKEREEKEWGWKSLQLCKFYLIHQKLSNI
jgi:hypothetical protein